MGQEDERNVKLRAQMHEMSEMHEMLRELRLITQHEPITPAFPPHFFQKGAREETTPHVSATTRDSVAPHASPTCGLDSKALTETRGARFPHGSQIPAKTEPAPVAVSKMAGLHHMRRHARRRGRLLMTRAVNPASSRWLFCSRNKASIASSASGWFMFLESIFKKIVAVIWALSAPCRLRNWERRSPDRRTRRNAPRHREADECIKTQRARLRRVGRSGDRPSLSHAVFFRPQFF